MGEMERVGRGTGRGPAPLVRGASRHVHQIPGSDRLLEVEVLTVQVDEWPGTAQASEGTWNPVECVPGWIHATRVLF